MNGTIKIYDPELNSSMVIDGDDANKELGLSIATNSSGRILATSGRDFVNVYTVVFE
jgi:hypothetical protein